MNLSSREEKNMPAVKSWTEASVVVARHKTAHAVLAAIGTVVLLPIGIVAGVALGVRLLYEGLHEEFRDREFQFEWNRRYQRALKAVREDA
jgi:hypothetical protein